MTAQEVQGHAPYPEGFLQPSSSGAKPVPRGDLLPEPRPGGAMDPAGAQQHVGGLRPRNARLGQVTCHPPCRGCSPGRSRWLQDIWRWRRCEDKVRRMRSKSGAAKTAVFAAANTSGPGQS